MSETKQPPPAGRIMVTRRHVLGGVALAAAAPNSRSATQSRVARSPATAPEWAISAETAREPWRHPGLSDANWIWYPSQRALPSSFVLFRKQVTLPAAPERAPLWISADSRYLLTVNGQRVQFGPAPCDPRQLDVDPVDVGPYLRQGQNVIAATVLFYGVGDGTWVAGKPGLLCFGSIEFASASPVRLATDASWQCHLSRAWRAGQYKRSYLRALQEQFDARLHPHGWDQPSFVADAAWRPAMKLDCPAHQPPLASGFRDDIYDVGGTQVDAVVRPRSIAAMKETTVPARFVQAHRLTWSVPIDEYFDVTTPDACRILPGESVAAPNRGNLRVSLDGTTSVAVTYALPEQMVGFPGFEVQAPAGTTIELLVQEGHAPGVVPIMNTHRHSWSRYVCRKGANVFRAFDFESCRWLQLHVHGPAGEVQIKSVSLLRRAYPFAQTPSLRTDDKDLNRLIAASFNTLANNAQETIVDGMGRERQQYSGDIGHCVHALHLLAGEGDLAARFLDTYCEGLTLEGYFLDCWPAPDRLVRIAQRQLGLTPWGPLLDHGLGFMFDCHHHLMYSGKTEQVSKPVGKLVRFFDYLHGLLGDDGLLPVENIGVPTVWIDHDAFAQQRHKQCAFNLYASAAFIYALSPLLRALGETRRAAQVEQVGKRLLMASIAKFWDPRRRLFVANLPWFAEEKKLRLDDRSLSQSVLFAQCPKGQTQAAVDALVNKPRELGLSYPPNVVWNIWALAAAGRAEAVLEELRQRWVPLRSVKENNTLSEHWQVEPDSRSQWSHAPMAAVLSFPMVFAGVRPTSLGWKSAEIRPQLAGLSQLQLETHTPRGPISFEANGVAGERHLSLVVPPGMTADLLVAKQETLNLQRLGPGRFRLPAGERVNLTLRHG